MTVEISFGVSSYSFHQRLSTGAMDLFQVIDWIAGSEAEHLELAVLSNSDAEFPVPNIRSAPDYVARVATAADAAGVKLSGLAVPADLSASDPAVVAEQVRAVKASVDLADRLGIRLLRHDVAPHPAVPGDDTPVFERAFPRIVEASKEIAEYAARAGIVTSLENHGFFVQSSDRVRRIVHAVGADNFKTTLDVGNFVCVDEDPAVAVAQNLPLATMVHFKDFYIRTSNPGEGWFPSRGGKFLRGAIVGNGDIDIAAVAAAISHSDYAGFATIEFEGEEDCLLGVTRGLANAKRLLSEA